MKKSFDLETFQEFLRCISETKYLKESTYQDMLTSLSDCQVNTSESMLSFDDLEEALDRADYHELEELICLEYDGLPYFITIVQTADFLNITMFKNMTGLDGYLSLKNDSSKIGSLNAFSLIIHEGISDYYTLEPGHIERSVSKDEKVLMYHLLSILLKITKLKKIKKKTDESIYRFTAKKDIKQDIISLTDIHHLYRESMSFENKFTEEEYQVMHLDLKKSDFIWCLHAFLDQKPSGDIYNVNLVLANLETKEILKSSKCHPNDISLQYEAFINHCKKLY